MYLLCPMWGIQCGVDELTTIPIECNRNVRSQWSNEWGEGQCLWNFKTMMGGCGLMGMRVLWGNR
jgi:hypothetical protein